MLPIIQGINPLNMEQNLVVLYRLTVPNADFSYSSINSSWNFIKNLHRLNQANNFVRSDPIANGNIGSCIRCGLLIKPAHYR